jgi:hypothetical protein
MFYTDVNFKIYSLLELCDCIGQLVVWYRMGCVNSKLYNAPHCVHNDKM